MSKSRKAEVHYCDAMVQSETRRVRLLHNQNLHCDRYAVYQNPDGYWLCHAHKCQHERLQRMTVPASLELLPRPSNHKKKAAE